MSVEPTRPQRTTARAMLDMLRRHYIPDERTPAYLLAPEIQAPGPTNRRADLIALGMVAATMGVLIGHEIKVTRADIQTELADLTKSDPWQRYCNRWYLVIPHLSLIEGLEIPDTWGVLLPPSGRRTRAATVHRKAPHLSPAEQAPALRVLAAWSHWRARDNATRAERLQQQLDRETARNHQLYNQVAAPHNPAHAVVARIIAELGPVYGDRIGEWASELHVDDAVTALKDLGAISDMKKKALWEIDTAKNSLSTIRSGADRLLNEITKEKNHDNDHF